MKPKVICYYESIDHMLSEDTCKLVEMWRRSWGNNGWDPIVLSIQDAERHPDYDRLDIVNPDNPLYINNLHDRGYQIACYRRHLAYSNFVLKNGTTLHADCDVINYNFSPLDYDLYDDNSIIGLACDVVKLSKSGAKDIVKAILKGVDVGPENDMKCYMHLTDVFTIIGNVKKWEDLRIFNNILTHYNECKTSKLVHYHNGLWALSDEPLYNIKYPHRTEFIQKFRPVL